MEKSTMSVQELSAQLGISLVKSYELVKTPGFPTLRIGTRILIPVDAYIWNSALKFYRGKVTKQPGYIPPADYNAPAEPKWEPPILFTQHTLPTFPVDAFPLEIRDDVLAVAETTQTPVDMAATAALAVLALCQQGKYRIKGKDDWIEPLNLFTVIVAEPSERKSAVISHMAGAVHRYEATYNQLHAAAVERSRVEKRMLEKEQHNILQRFYE